jgi:hydrogenase nickel incorporation protein HypA/HybF
MHEVSIAQGLLQIVLDEVKKHSISKVTVVKLKIGELTGVQPSALTFCFELMTKDTPVEGADLRIDVVPIKAKCLDCDDVFVTEDYSFFCPGCSGSNTELVSGRELHVHEIEGD